MVSPSMRCGNFANCSQSCSRFSSSFTFLIMRNSPFSFKIVRSVSLGKPSGNVIGIISTACLTVHNRALFSGMFLTIAQSQKRMSTENCCTQHSINPTFPSSLNSVRIVFSQCGRCFIGLIRLTRNSLLGSYGGSLKLGSLNVNCTQIQPQITIRKPEQMGRFTPHLFQFQIQNWNLAV